MPNIKRIILEQGKVLGKVFKSATTEFEGSDGKMISAQPDRYIVKTVSGEFDKENGFKDSLIMDCKVDKDTFDSLKPFDSVEIRFEFSAYGQKFLSLSKKNN